MLIVLPVLIAVPLLATAARRALGASAATRDRHRAGRAAFVAQHPDLAYYAEVAALLAEETSADAAEEVTALARSRSVPALLLSVWMRSHGAEMTVTAVRAGLSADQMRRHAHSLAGLDLESVALSAELQMPSLGVWSP